MHILLGGSKRETAIARRAPLLGKRGRSQLRERCTWLVKLCAAEPSGNAPSLSRPLQHAEARPQARAAGARTGANRTPWALERHRKTLNDTERQKRPTGARFILHRGHGGRHAPGPSRPIDRWRAAGRSRQTGLVTSGKATLSSWMYSPSRYKWTKQCEDWPPRPTLAARRVMADHPLPPTLPQRPCLTLVEPIHCARAVQTSHAPHSGQPIDDRWCDRPLLAFSRRVELCL